MLLASVRSCVVAGVVALASLWLLGWPDGPAVSVAQDAGAAIWTVPEIGALPNDANGRLVRRGRIPSVAEVAQSAGVSRATAYRYFPSRSSLVSAVIAEALGPVRRAVPQHGDAKQRLHELLDRTYSRFAEYEPHMRAALQLALEHQSLEAAGVLEEKPFRRGQRTEILATTLHPLKRRLKPRTYRRLLKALAVVYGIEPMIILKDICGATDRETEAVVRWMMDALVDAALREAK